MSSKRDGINLPPYNQELNTTSGNNQPDTQGKVDQIIVADAGETLLFLHDTEKEQGWIESDQFVDLEGWR